MMIKEEGVLGHKRKRNNFKRAGRGGRSLILQLRKKNNKNTHIKKPHKTKQKTQSQNGLSKLRCNLISHL